MRNILCLSLIYWISGCSALMTQKQALLPQDTPTMQAVYQAHLGQQPVHALNHVVLDQPANELDTLFPRVPNPDIQIYIDPHISAAGIPIPGYTTQVSLYRQNYYALPGELTHEDF